MLRLQVAGLLVIGVLSLHSCDIPDSSPEDCGYSFGFEREMRCWTARGIDLVVGGEEVD